MVKMLKTVLNTDKTALAKKILNSPNFVEITKL